MELEDRFTVPSAEGIDLDLVLAGVGSRGAAQVVDFLLEVLLLFVVALAASAFGDAGVAVLAISSLLIFLGYPILFEAFNDGRSIGKVLLGIRVVAIDGSPETFLEAVIRNVVRFIDVLPGVYTVGFIAVLATPRSQRIGDLAASTLVVRRAKAPEGPPAVPWSPAPVEVLSTWDLSALSDEEVAAVREFLGRRAQFAPQARAQLADALARQVAGKVVGVPFDGGPEVFLERVVAAKQRR